MDSSSIAPTSPPSSVSAPNAPTPPSSPPETLSSQSSFDEPESGYVHPEILYENEPFDAYRPGGLHPVHLGDLFHHGRLMMVRKLGHGSFSTVWLAKDTLNSDYVAVKIKTAETSVDTSELSILSYLKQKGTSDPMSKHVIALLDHFEHQGPNGKHACIVSEALGASVTTVLTTCPKYFHGYRMFFPKWMAKRILRQVLMGICFLHSHGVIHGDLHMGNILFAAPSPDSYTAKELEHDETMKSVVITRPNRTRHKCAPRYIAMTSPLIEDCYDRCDLTVKITDLGGGKFMANTNIYKRLFNSDLAFTFGDTSKNPETPQSLRAPERIFGNPLDQSIDIWSFGCLMFELLTAMSLFPIMPGQGKDHHILTMVDVLGPLPERLLSQWDQAHRFFRSNGEQFNSMLNGPNKLLPADSLETIFHREKFCEFDAGEEESVIDMLKQILSYEPEKRPSAEKLLSHPWFADIGT